MRSLENINIILVNTSHPGNIGGSARAMKNMGLNQLTLVAPEDFPSGVAVGRAVTAVDILDNAVVVQSLEEAIKNCGLVIGTSARSRRIPWPTLEPEQCAEKLLLEPDKNQVAVVFGREDAGLTNEELQLCHYHVQIPTNPDYSSLNLASAVQVICYELRKTWLRLENFKAATDDEIWDVERATGEQIEHFYEHLERVLIAIDFHDPENPRQLLHRVRRMFGRIRMDTMELNILRGILTNIEYHIDKRE